MNWFDWPYHKVYFVMAPFLALLKTIYWQEKGEMKSNQLIPQIENCHLYVYLEKKYFEGSRCSVFKIRGINKIEEKLFFSTAPLLQRMICCHHILVKLKRQNNWFNNFVYKATKSRLYTLSKKSIHLFHIYLNLYV